MVFYRCPKVCLPLQGLKGPLDRASTAVLVYCSISSETAEFFQHYSPSHDTKPELHVLL
ncbi:TPA: hypothetical protein ACH3X2_000809 [Trebouxia sp. C0005]